MLVSRRRYRLPPRFTPSSRITIRRLRVVCAPVHGGAHCAHVVAELFVPAPFSSPVFQLALSVQMLQELGTLGRDSSGAPSSDQRSQVPQLSAQPLDRCSLVQPQITVVLHDEALLHRRVEVGPLAPGCEFFG